MRVLAEVANISEALGGRVHEEVGADGMEDGTGDDLVELVHFGGLDVDYVEYIEWPIYVPEVDSEVVGRDEIFTISGKGERVNMDVVVLSVGVFSLVLRCGVLPGIDRLWDLEMLGVGDDRIQLAALVTVVALASALRFLEYAPQFDCLVVCREHQQIL